MKSEIVSKPIKFALVLPVTVKTLWQYWFDSQLRALWWSAHVILEEKLFGKFIEPWQDDDGNIVLTQGEIIEIKPDEFVSLTWADPGWNAVTLLTLSFKPSKTGSRLELVHSGWEYLRPSVRLELRRTHEQGWQELLELLKKEVEKV